MSTSVRSTLLRARSPSLDGWRLTELLSQDLWTRTFRAYSTANRAGSAFAVKQARSDLATDHDRDLAVGLLQREATVTGQVRQRNLAATLDIIRRGDEIWLVQPFLAGAALSGSRELALSVTLWAIRQTAQALAALHRAGWLHGNVSTEAIVVGTAGHTTLGELGWCRQLATDECDLGRTPFLGQILYAAPEMFDDVGRLSPAADIYSLGVVLAELLTGSVPFADYDGRKMIAAKRLLAAPGIEAADIPYEISSLVARMLSRDPLRRPTAGEVVDTLIAAEVATLSG